jgi:hypothetical protein
MRAEKYMNLTIPAPDGILPKSAAWDNMPDPFLFAMEIPTENLKFMQ